MAQVEQKKSQEAAEPQKLTPEEAEERKQKVRDQALKGIALLTEYGPRMRHSILGTSSVDYFRGKATTGLPFLNYSSKQLIVRA